ncbi:hypothetical protein PR048_011759 [Dryococelus australis]|uniref:Uncharacterized protein n=1 Tax=Dryococelus australis TaxID=614101 RepID=A0ABQ9HN89_9NEOP|nr:hypothetical protein PR048_011759 [Dryococelus australis]
MGPYPTKKRFLLVMTDLCTKWCEAYPLPSSCLKNITGVVENGFFARWSYPIAQLWLHVRNDYTFWATYIADILFCLRNYQNLATGYFMPSYCKAMVLLDQENMYAHKQCRTKELLDTEAH